MNSIKRKIGVLPNIKSVIGEDLTHEKLSFKHTQVNSHSKYGMNHNHMAHEVMALQISNYICIDEDKNPLQMIMNGYEPKTDRVKQGNILAKQKKRA